MFLYGIHLFRSFHPSAALPALSAVLQRMQGAAARLSAQGVLGAPPGALHADPAGGMVACYGRGARYSRHTDSEPDDSPTRRLTFNVADKELLRANRPRTVTAIVYLRGAGDSEWAPHDGGELRLWHAT